MINQVHFGDVRMVLPQLADKRLRVNCVVTSPPYWGLRDYKTGTWTGGDPSCKHQQREIRRGLGLAESPAATRGGAKKIKEVGWIQFKDECAHCGAKRVDNQLGLEALHDCLGWATGVPCGECYICHLVEVFRGVWDVLADDGVVLLNLGDSYAGSVNLGDSYAGSGRGGNIGNETSGLEGIQPNHSRDAAEAHRQIAGKAPPEAQKAQAVTQRGRRTAAGLKQKDLCMIPARAALALQADGWYLRMDIIWHKPNGLPESVDDRPTKAHEYIWLLSKREDYYWDKEAIAEPVTESSLARVGQAGFCDQKGGAKDYGTTGVNANRSSRKTIENFAGSVKKYSFAREQPKDIGANGQKPQFRPDRADVAYVGAMRNARSVWTIPTKPYSGAHFAVFPEDIPERATLAGTSAKGHCPDCGAGWDRITAKGGHLKDWQLASGSRLDGSYEGKPKGDYEAHGAQNASAVKARILDGMRERVTLGWYPSCACYGLEALERTPADTPADIAAAIFQRNSARLAAAVPLKTVPGIVMDCFFGSGTTGEVAGRLGRDWVGIELNKDYEKLQQERTAQPGLRLV